MNNRRFHSGVLGLAIGVMAGAGQRPEGQKDAQSRFEPRSEPGAGQKYLEGFAGEWEVIKTFYPLVGEPVRVRGTCRQTMIHEGRFLQSEFVFDQAGKKTTGMGIVGFDPETGRFSTVWTDARSTRMSLRQSRERFDGKEIVLHGRSLEDDGKGPMRSRTVSRLEANGNRIVHRQFAVAADGHERLIMDLIMTRRQAENAQARKRPGLN
jgi:hypothetical protein